MFKSTYYTQQNAAPPQYSPAPPPYHSRASSYHGDDYDDEKRRYQQSSPHQHHAQPSYQLGPSSSQRHDHATASPPRDYNGDYSNSQHQYHHHQQQLQPRSRRSPSPQMAPGPLSLPVIIPQQRPGAPERGFMAAYAPMLQSAGIDQRAFLTFLDAFNTAVRGNKVLAGVQVVSFGAAFTPDVVTFCVATAVQMGAHAANRGFVRHQTNACLDRHNRDLFAPRGLYCMIMRYDPAGQDADADAANGGKKRNGGSSSWLRDPVSGTAEGAPGLPAAVAPLVYMEDRRAHKEYLDETSTPSSSPLDKTSSPPPTTTTTKQRALKAFDSLNDYLDRRARAKYAAENQDVHHALNAPSSTTKNSGGGGGGLVGLLSGGGDPETRRRRKLRSLADEEDRLRGEYRERVDQVAQQRQSARESERQVGYIDRDYRPRFAELARRRRELEAGPERSIRDNVLYLSIVNRPSDAQLAAAADRIGHGGVVPGGARGQVL